MRKNHVTGSKPTRSPSDAGGVNIAPDRRDAARLFAAVLLISAGGDSQFHCSTKGRSKSFFTFMLVSNTI